MVYYKFELSTIAISTKWLLEKFDNESDDKDD